MGTHFLPFNAPKPVSPMPADSPHSELSWFYSFGVMAASCIYFPPNFWVFFYVGTVFTLLIGTFFFCSVFANLLR
jgi:hypothetical protein